MNTPDVPDAADFATEARHRFAAELTDPSDPWRDALAHVPRHLLVPEFLMAHEGIWQTPTPGTEDWLRLVYSDHVLVTGLDAEGRPMSSSTQPSLMLDMLRALDPQPGQRVLEVGTGPGYNAALLAHRLRGEHVTTIEADEQLALRARLRLAQAGYRPRVVTGDGIVGVPDRAPFNRIIVTCRPAWISPAWVEQTTDGGVIVSPLGNGVARLDVRGDRAEGRFLTVPAYFMPLRTSPLPPPAPPNDAFTAEPARTSVPLERVSGDLRFALSIMLPDHQCVPRWDDDGVTTEIQLWTYDGSAVHADAEGRVWHKGPRNLWSVIEQCHALWPDHAPARSEFGLTITPTSQRVWHAAPDGHSWDLAAPPAIEALRRSSSRNESR
ncbi:rRNA adenine N-6-methyltransferase family protein [Streptomyces millisiae]|uniref:Protein-L-isoaspartate O-methyltransferase n=1 Tax=Streptomyces millisiae TaxID=3075542 RepID=A0ABU2LWB8_9ACTN|nr:rRNA adenine N-6-methyltransferase family protein [Streptomyces sp. DSM 44918]MDT0321878.1 rRNA adenine N-6-methyltransferase family protein [Streptomyces sp. DSM 44918]